MSWRNDPITATDIAYIISSSSLSSFQAPRPRSFLFCKLREQCLYSQIVWKMYDKTIIEFGFAGFRELPNLVSVLSAEAKGNTGLGFDNSWLILLSLTQ